jgi:hypothetical protein
MSMASEALFATLDYRAGDGELQLLRNRILGSPRGNKNIIFEGAIYS